MALTREEAEKLAQLRGKTSTSPIKNTSSPVDAWTKGMESDTQQKIDPIALQNEWAQLPYDARDEMLLRAMKNGNTYILQSYPEDERGWQKFSGLKLDDRFIQTVPKFQNTTISQGQSIDRASVEAQLKTEADPLRQAELRTQLEQAPKQRDVIERIFSPGEERSLYDRIFNPEEDDIYGRIIEAEKAINTNERLAQMKANERANGVDYLVRMKANAPTEGVTNVFNEFGKGFARASQQVLGGVFGTVEMLSEGDPYLVWLNDYAQNQADAVRSSILKTPEFNRASSTKNFLEGGASDPNYYASVMGSILPHIAGAMTATVMGGVVGGAPGAVAGASAYSFTMESGSLYNDLLAEGYDMEEARLASMKYGAIAGALDSVIPAKIGGSVANTFTNQLLKHGMKQSAKKTLAQTIKEFGKDVLIEASTEASQELAQNITKKYFNENQDIWENVMDSFVGGTIGGGVFGAIGAGNNAVQGKTETLPEGMRNYSAENGYQGADAQALASEKVTPKVKKSLQSYEQTVGIAEQAKQGFARLEEVEYGLQASIRLAELMKAKDPTDMTVSQIQEQAGQELEKVNVQKQLLEKQYEQGTKVDVVALPEFTMSVGETIDGKFVASADLVLETGSDILANPTKYDTRAEAELGMTELVQEYIGDKLRSDSIESFDIETLSKVNQELLSFVSQPNPQRMIRENRDVMLLAQDMKDYGKFEKAVRKNNLLPEGTDISSFYQRARSAEANYITAREARGIVEKYAKDIGVSTEFVQGLTTPQGKRALGSFMRDERVIKLVTRGEEGMPDVEITTPYHEVGHAYFQTMMTPSERAEVLQEIKNNSTKELTDKEAEEILVEDLRAYNDKKTLKALKKTIQPAYARLLDSIKEIVDKVLKWIGRSSEDKINQFYEDVLSMKRPSEKVAMDIEKQQEVYRATAEEKAELVVLHNTTIENLKKSVELGGLPVPSLAITKGSIPFTDFGDITLVGGSSIIDPSLDSRNKVFSVDAYTPRVPQEKYEVDKKLMASLYDKIYKDIPSDILISSKDSVFYNAFSDIESLEDLQGNLYRTVSSLYLYAKENNLDPEIVYSDIKNEILTSSKTDIRKNLLENIDIINSITDRSFESFKKGGEVYEKISPIIDAYLDEIQSKTGDGEMYNNFKNIYYSGDGLSFGTVEGLIYDAKKINVSKKVVDEYGSLRKLQKQIDRTDFNNWVSDKFGSIFGKKYFTKGNRNIDYTFENLVSAMSGNTIAQEKGITDSGFGKLQAMGSKKLSSIKQIQKTKERLVSKEEGETTYERLKKEYADIGMDIEYKYENAGFFERMDSLISAFKKYFKGAKTIENLNYALRSQYFTPSPEILQRAYTFAEEVMNIPMSYMEAKPQRGVYLSEFSGVVVPQEQYEQVRSVLRGTVLYNQIYTYNSQEERTAMVEKVAEEKDISFRESPSSLEEEALKYDTVEEFMNSVKTQESLIDFWKSEAKKQIEKLESLEKINVKKSETSNKWLYDIGDGFMSSPFSTKAKTAEYAYKQWEQTISYLKTDYVKNNTAGIKDLPTKQQLNDAYNKAHGESLKENDTEDTAWTVPENEEVKKYKSAEEFANAKINEKYNMIRDRNDINMGISTSVETANNNTKRQRIAEQKTINALAKEGKIRTIKLGDGKLSPLSEKDWETVYKNTPKVYQEQVSTADYNKMQSEYTSFIKIYNKAHENKTQTEKAYKKGVSVSAQDKLIEESELANVKYNEFKAGLFSVADDPVAIYELIAEIYPEAVVDFEKGIIDYSQTDIPTQYIEEATFDDGVSVEDLRYIIINSKKPELKNIDQESFWDDLPSYVPKPSKSIDDALYEVGVEMQIAEKGYRYGIEGWDHFNKTVAMHSTFPDWVRDPYRSSILLQQAAQYMDGKFRIPATYKTGLRSVVWDAYEEASRRSGGAIDIDALRKRFEETDKKLVRTPRRIDYKKFATPITAEDKSTIEQLYNEAPGYSDVYSEDTAYASLEFLQKAYDTERELLSRTGSPFPEELAQLLRDVHAYSLAGLEDLIRTITEANIRFMDKNYELFLEVPNTMFLRAKSYEELLSMVREYDSELAGRLLALENGKDLYATYTRFMNKYYDTKKAVKMQRSLEKVESQDMKQIENAVAKLKDMRIKFIQKQEAEAYKKTERQRVKNVARMINLVDRKRIKDLETEITMSDKQYLKDMYKAQAKGANASALETARIIKQKLRETRKYKEMIGKVEALRRRVRASVKTGGRYYVEYARKLLAVFDEYDTSSLSNRSMEKLQDIYEMMYNNEQISDEMKDWYKKNIERVSKKSLREMTYDEVVELYTMLSSLANKGAYELAQVQYFSEQEKERRIALAIESTRNMDGEGRKGTTRAEMSQGAFKEALVRTGLDVLSPVAVMDKFDGGKNFTGWNAMQVRSLQKGEQKWYAQLHGATDELKARVQEIKPTFTAKEETFLSLVARSREEADGAVKNLLSQLGVDIIPAQVEGLTLEQAEQIIDIIEDISEKYQITTQLKTIFESRTNKPFPVKKHYVAPLKYTNRITDTTDADIEALQNFSEYGTEVGEGMSIARMEKVDLEVRTDLLTLVTEGWNHSLYYINMQPRVDNIQSVVGSKDFKDHAGRIVSKYWKEYLAGVANKGKSMGNGTFDPILRSLRQNFQVAILGFKATTVLLQFTAGFNAVMTANALHGSDTALAIMAELAQAYIVPSYKADALTQSEALTLRAGSAGSTDFAEINRLMETGLADLRGNYSKLKAGAIKAGMYMIQEVDIRTASAVRQGMYKALIARGVPEAKASADADFFMSLSQSSTQLVDRPLILARYGEFGRLFFTFQTFTLGLWSMITQGLVVNGLIKGTPKVKIKSALALLAIPFFTAFAGEMISIVNNAIKGKDDEEELEDKLKNALENTWVELVATVPLFGSIIKGKVLYNRNYEVPLVGTGLELIDGIQGLMDPKDYDDFIKNLTTVGKTGSIFAGIPGAFQATDIINRFIITEKERKTIETNLVARQYIDSGERNLDQYVAQLASKLYSTEELVKLDKAKLTALKKSILKSVVKMGDNEEAKNIMKLSTNDEKANYLKEIRSLYGAQEYKDLLEYLKKYGILSKEAELLIYKK